MSSSLRCWVFGKAPQMFCLWMCCAVWLAAQEWFFMLTSLMSRYRVREWSHQTSSVTDSWTGMWCVLVFLSLQSLLAGASDVSSLAPAVKAVDGALSELEVFVRGAATKAPGYMELAARDLAYSLARIYTGSYHDHRFYMVALWCCYFSALLIHLSPSDHREISSFWVHTGCGSQFIFGGVPL